MHSENNSKILITGVGSGLGKHIHEKIPNSLGMSRNNCIDILRSVRYEGVDTIIHCACNKSRDEYYDLYNDNLKLTEELCDIPHKNFIFASSVDVYSDTNNIYNMMKRISEDIIKKRSNKFLILRLSALLGKHMKKNNIVKAVCDEFPILSLTKDSTYSLISYEHVLKIIVESLKRDIFGTYDVVAKKEISMNDIVKYCGKVQTTKFGQYKYLTKKIDGGKIEEKLGLIQSDSQQVLESFINEL